MQRIRPFLLFSLTLFSCRQRYPDQQIAAITQSLSESKTVIGDNNDTYYSALAGQLTHQRAPQYIKVWKGPVTAIRENTKAIIQYIDSLQTRLQTGDDAAAKQLLEQERERLYQRLQEYYDKAMQTLQPERLADHPNGQLNLRMEVKQLKKYIGQPFEKINDAVLRQLTRSLAIALLQQSSSQVLFVENRLLDFCLQHTSFRSRPCDIVGAIAMVNTSYVKAGQEIEVIVGQGDLAYDIVPWVTINGVTDTAGSADVIVCKFKAKRKPGTYELPVKIEYVKPDGSIASFTKKLSYIIRSTDQP